MNPAWRMSNYEMSGFPMLQVFGETLVTERMWMDGLIFLLDCCLCPISPACWDLAMYICGVSTLSPQVSFWREF